MEVLIGKITNDEVLVLIHEPLGDFSLMRDTLTKFDEIDRFEIEQSIDLKKLAESQLMIVYDLLSEEDELNMDCIPLSNEIYEELQIRKKIRRERQRQNGGRFLNIPRMKISKEVFSWKKEGF